MRPNCQNTDHVCLLPSYDMSEAAIHTLELHNKPVKHQKLINCVIILRHENMLNIVDTV